MPREDSVFEANLLRRQLETSLATNIALAKENEELRQEVSRLKAQNTALRAHSQERKSMLWKKLQNSMDNNTTTTTTDNNNNNVEVSQQKPVFLLNLSGNNSPAYRQDSLEQEAAKDKPTISPNLPPNPPPVFRKDVREHKESSEALPAPPPPPPMPSKALVGAAKTVHRVPEVIELYRSLTRRDIHSESKSSPTGSKVPALALTKNMIGEIENRSTYISAVKSEVETQAEFINLLIKEVESSAHKKISEVEAFVGWLDKQLSTLVDERAVLRHFPRWPERKADTLREAAFTYRDLRSLRSEVLSFEDNPRESLGQATRRVQELQDRLERSVSNVERTREGTSKRYRDFKIPWEWMTDTGLIGEMKLSSLRLAKEYMKRITKELQTSEGTSEDDNILLHGVRFAHRVHQFEGGFDAQTTQAFQELKRVGIGSARK